MRAAVDHSVAILGTGSYLPKRIVNNRTLRDICQGYDAERSGDFVTWVDRVTHIQERHYVAEGETAADMGAVAAQRALDAAGVKATELDLIVHASFTSSNIVPGDHVLVARAIGADTTPSFTLTAACAGSVQGMSVAAGMLAAGYMNRILVVASETISPTLDFSDLLTTILFGDGAGAVVLGRVSDCDGGILRPHLGHEFNYENIVMNNANLPFTSTVAEPAKNGTPPLMEKEYLRMKSGPSVLRNAVNAMAGSVRQVLGYGAKEQSEELNDTIARARIVPHQANGRIVDGIAKKLRADPELVIKTVHKTGNISAASNLIALDFAMRKGNYRAEVEAETGRILDIHVINNPVKKGDLVVLPTIGAGYLFGAFGFVHAG